MTTAHTEILSALEAGKMVILTNTMGVFSLTKFAGVVEYSQLSYIGDHSAKRELSEERLNKAIDEVVKFSII